MAKILDPKRLSAELGEVLKEFSIKSVDHAEKAIRISFINVATRIIKETPVDEGRARGNWFTTIDKPSTRMIEKGSAESRIKELESKLSKGIFDKTFFLTNNLPYIGVLEYGGYPSPVKKGTKNKSTGAYEIRSIKGFSQLAPKGMVRINVLKWRKILRRAIKGTA